MNLNIFDEAKKMLKVNVINSKGEIYSVLLNRSKPVKSQLLDYFKVYTKIPTKSMIFMVDGAELNQETCEDLGIKMGDAIDLFMRKTNSIKTVNPRLIKHLKSEGFDLSKFTFYG